MLNAWYCMRGLRPISPRTRICTLRFSFGSEVGLYWDGRSRMATVRAVDRQNAMVMRDSIMVAGVDSARGLTSLQSSITMALYRSHKGGYPKVFKCTSVQVYGMFSRRGPPADLILSIVARDHMSATIRSRGRVPQGARAIGRSPAVRASSVKPSFDLLGIALR